MSGIVGSPVYNGSYQMLFICYWLLLREVVLRCHFPCVASTFGMGYRLKVRVVALLELLFDATGCTVFAQPSNLLVRPSRVVAEYAAGLESRAMEDRGGAL